MLVNLELNIASGGTASGDTFYSIENLIGSDVGRRLLPKPCLRQLVVAVEGNLEGLVADLLGLKKLVLNVRLTRRR